MANKTLNISDADRVARRAEQLKKVGYKCEACGFTVWGRRGGRAICANCLDQQVEDADGVQVGEQMLLFGFRNLVPLVVMAETSTTAPGKASDV